MSFDALLVRMAIGFAIRQIEKFGAAVDWNLVRQDCYARVKQLVPNAVADAVLDTTIGFLLTVLEKACRDPTIVNGILGLMQGGGLNQAIGLVEDLVGAPPGDG
jgi:hypothetical protein